MRIIVIPNQKEGVGKSIFEYRPESHGAEDYLALCKEIVERG